MSQSRRYNNRSRSGSEEIKQIFASQNGIKNRAVSSSSSSNASTSVTPVPQDQLNYSTGLLGWMRNALLPSTSSPYRSGTSPNRQSNQDSFVSSENDPVDRQDTPLLPGIVPSFHRRVDEKRVEEASSYSYHEETPSTNGWSLEPLDRSQRRPSVVSAISTLEDEAGSSNSSDEDIYTPFTANEDFLRLGTQNDDLLPRIGAINGEEDYTYPTTEKNSEGIDHQSSNALKLASKPRLNLTTDQACHSQEIVEDIAPRPQISPSVILISPDRESSDVRPMSPIAGWTDDCRTPNGLNFALLSPLDDASADMTRESSSFYEDAGDGEDYQDHSELPLSPQEIASLRPSKESVVLGSRGAHNRLAAVQNRDLPAANKSDGKVDYWQDPRLKTPLAQNSNSDTVAPLPEVEPSDDASSSTLIDTMTPQPKRASGFFNRRRQVPSKSVTNADEETLSLQKVASNSGQRWRIGKKSINDSPVTKSDDTIAKVGRHQASQRSNTRSSISSDAGTVNSRRSNFSIPGDSPIMIKAKDSLKVKGIARNALGAKMQPFAVKVRSKNKAIKERDFSRLYLAQELFLGAPAASRVSSNVSSIERSGSLSSNNSLQFDRANSVASSTKSAGNSNGHLRRRATWAMKFSLDGKYLAVAGQDAIIRVYAVLDNPEAREKIERQAELAIDEFETLNSKSCPFSSSSTLSYGSLGRESTGRSSISSREINNKRSESSSSLPNLAVFQSEPIRQFKGHSNDILELSWSKGGFLLSASMDKTARIWHMSMPNSLVSFVHGDFVTSAVFHPRDDRFFLSGSLDGKLRLWNITLKQVEYCQEVPGLITACAFTESGDTACVGTFAGHALFYRTEGLTYSSSIAVKSPSGKHSKGGRKITAIEPLFSVGKVEDADALNKKRGTKKGESVLITSNDSRVRVYNLGNKSMTARFKAKTYNNRTSQIRACVADDFTYVVAGSEANAASGESGQVHIWDCSVISSEYSNSDNGADTKKNSIVTADSAVEYFTAHNSTVTCAVMAPLNTNIHLRASGDYIVQQCDMKLRSPRSIAAIKDAVKKSENEAKLNRIIISVDESAVVRVWRSDNLHTVEV